MPRWSKPPAVGSAERDALEREAAAEVHRRVEMVNGTIRPEDQQPDPARADVQVVVGKSELVALAAQVTDVSTSARYDAVNKMITQPWMVRLSNGMIATVPSSGTHYLVRQRHDEAHEKEVEAGREAANAARKHRPAKRKGSDGDAT